VRVSRPQRGFLLIAAVVVIAVTGIMAVAIVTLTAGSGQAGGEHVSSTQALFIAESGLERGINRWAADSSYTGETLTVGPGSAVISVANTDFTGAPLSASQKRIISVGTVNAAVRRVEVIVNRNGALFTEQFPSASDFTTNWSTQVLTNSQGSTSFNGTINCPAATCPNTQSGTGSMQAQTLSTGSNNRLSGYRQRNLPTAIATGVGLNIDVSLGYQLFGGNINSATNLSVRLFDSAAGIETTVWGVTVSSCGVCSSNTATWFVGAANTVSLPAGRTYDRIRLFFDLREQGNNQVSSRFDVVQLSAAGGGGAGVTRQSWREVFP
jgi:hypothetical protein